MSQIPQKLTNFRVYGDDAQEFLGTTDIDLPALEQMSEIIMGAGLAGEYDAPVIGHFKAMQLKLKFRAVTEKALLLMAPVRHVIDCRGSISVIDSAGGPLTSKALRVECTGETKHKGLGKMEPGKAMGAEADLEVATLRISIDDVPYIEIDKFNMIFKVDGFDYLAKIRQDMGGV